MADTRRGHERPRLSAVSRPGAALCIGLFRRGASWMGRPNKGVASRGARRLRVLQQRVDGIRAEERGSPAGARFGLNVARETSNAFGVVCSALFIDASVAPIPGGGTAYVEAVSRYRSSHARCP